MRRGGRHHNDTDENGETSDMIRYRQRRRRVFRLTEFGNDVRVWYTVHVSLVVVLSDGLVHWTGALLDDNRQNEC
jgi:hypothetical protein